MPIFQCEYVSQLSDSLFGVGTKESQAWFKEQRHTLRHDSSGVQKVVTRAAQQKRRHGLAGGEKDYNSSKGYLSRYRPHMDYAKRRSEGDPIGSGVTEAGCKVIFNQRMKQSGMRWSKKGGQWIVDLRTACRSKLWNRIWDRYLNSYDQLPEINQAQPFNCLAAAREIIGISATAPFLFWCKTALVIDKTHWSLFILFSIPFSIKISAKLMPAETGR